MLDFEKVSMPTDLSWFARRYNALIVGFPMQITPEALKKDDICSRFDADEATEALKSAHSFLSSVADEMLNLADNENKMAIIEKTFLKIDFLWSLGYYGKVCEEGNEYCFAFEKKNLRNHRRTLPKSYTAAFDAISENGCYAEYFKNGEEVKGYKNCDNGMLHFDDRLTALGIYLFVRKCAQKRWYWDEDAAGSYTEKLAYDPVMHCTEPYYRVDMRVFVCNERLKYDIYEQLAGYSDEIVGYFKMIYDFVKILYPDCLPKQGFYNYICCAVNFMADLRHNMLGAVGLGHNEHSIGFYGSMSGKVKEAAIAELGDEMKQSDWFDIASGENAEYAIKIMKIKAEYGKNIIPKKKEQNLC